ncbi:MAG: dephospho-CoA kinase [Pseudomonadota bacterium]
MIVLGLTGSIGMGKSTTAKMFADAGVPVWDADAVVHRLYGPGGAGAAAIARIAPAVVSDAGVDRGKLRDAVLADPHLLKQVEAAIHPLVGQDRAGFIAEAKAAGRAIVVCDIPLLYEGSSEGTLDKVVVVTAPADVQRSRVLDRPGMSEAAFEAILAKQVPDAVKREKADFLIDTSLGMAVARTRVADIIAELEGSDA